MTVHEMTLTRLLDAPADKLFRCWTTPDLIKQWFAPKPYTTPVAEVDPRPGGARKVVMKPDGQEIPCPASIWKWCGPQIVFTDAFTGDWCRDGAPFAVATISFELRQDVNRHGAPTGAKRTAQARADGFIRAGGQCRPAGSPAKNPLRNKP
jgi:uncharacterized protein YndB with AHSA1/START domain